MLELAYLIEPRMQMM